MSGITICLDGQADVDLGEFCRSTGSARDQVIKALINVTRKDRRISRLVAGDMGSLHPASPWTSARTVNLENLAGVDLRQWCGEADPARAIEAMVRVMLRGRHVGGKVKSRLLGQAPADPSRTTPSSPGTRVPSRPLQQPEPGPARGSTAVSGYPPAARPPFPF